MGNLLAFVLIVIVLLCLALWLVHVLPFPPEVPPPLKAILMVVLIFIAVVAIADRAGLLRL
jgi:hypothetical protein